MTGKAAQKQWVSIYQSHRALYPLQFTHLMGRRNHHAYVYT